MNSGKVMKFSLNSEKLRIKEILKNKDFIKVEIWAISDQYPNNNNSHFPLETMKENIKRENFFDKPVLGKFNNLYGDYEEHNSSTQYDPDLDLTYDEYEDGETPMGFIRNQDEVKLVEQDGEHWIVFTATLWVKYNYQKIKRLLKDKRKKVSVEVTIYESHVDENEVEIFDDWSFDGVTILGNIPNTNIPIKEGIAGAHLNILEKVDSLFSAKVKKLQFAYQDLDSYLSEQDNQSKDINEQKSSLYINNEEKEDMKLLTIEQKNLLEASLKNVFAKENSEFVMGEVENDVVKFSIDSEEKETTFTFSDETNEFTFGCDCDDIDDEDKKEEPSEENDEGSKEEEACQDTVETESCPKTEETSEEMESIEMNSEEEPVEECGTPIFSEETEEPKEESCEIPVEECGTVFVEEEEETEEETEACTEENDVEDDKECQFVEIDNEKYDLQALFAKYSEDMSKKDEQFKNLQENYERLFTDYEKIKVDLTKAQNATFAAEMKSVAMNYQLKTEIIDKIIADCEMGKFSSKEDCMKEIIYQKFIMDNENQVNQEKTFSAPIVSVNNKEEKEETDVFGKLKKYVTR